MAKMAVSTTAANVDNVALFAELAVTTRGVAMPGHTSSSTPK
jgi:hypothetical protein